MLNNTTGMKWKERLVGNYSTNSSVSSKKYYKTIKGEGKHL